MTIGPAQSELVHDGSATLDRLMTITKLGEGVDATGRLSPAAIERTIAALREYRAVMDRHGVERVRITATSAARDAANADEFFDAAEAVVGTRPELLSGLDEGRLSFRGATAELDPADFPAVLVNRHAPFTWGKNVAKAVEVAVAVECIADMALSSLQLEPQLPTIEEALLNKHFKRKHGPGAYYGQSGNC